MDINKVLEEKFKKQLEYLESLSTEERNEIKNKELSLSYKIKELLDKKGIAISDIDTSFHKNFKTKDDEIIDAFNTVYTSSITQRANSITTNAETMEMLYVRIGVMKFYSIKDFFDLEQ
ncbi:hypothetical protein H2O64_05845 [Kordia sp. YSTF-M3]|uniref:Uncharacterized protein n=1 Tax=Kordia aestuariivivens TaxID=2759037 RepID=A0ABR7Q6L4_9FLAO|nr:hypothetical protein [Kordia aestuariivivens]MBC8754185.1 hypothetical protein [Kordia aestuariivivens]